MKRLFFITICLFTLIIGISCAAAANVSDFNANNVNAKAIHTNSDVKSIDDSAVPGKISNAKLQNSNDNSLHYDDGSKSPSFGPGVYIDIPEDIKPIYPWDIIPSDDGGFDYSGFRPIE